MSLPSLDQVESELGEHGKAWRTVYSAVLRDAEAAHGVGVMNGCFGTVSWAVQIRHGYRPMLTDTVMLNKLHRLAAAMASPVEPVVQQLKDVSDRPLFTGIPESIKQ